MTDAEAIRLMREHYEGLFPKTCAKCGRHYPVLRDYILNTRPAGPAISYDVELRDWQPTSPLGTIAAGNIGAAGWNYQAERLRLDLSGDYYLNRRYGLYFTVRNIFNNRDQNFAYATGGPRYVKFASEGEYGVNFQFGLKGAF